MLDCGRLGVVGLIRRRTGVGSECLRRRLITDPVCNMSAFLKQARGCWKEAAVYSDKPEGICAHKVDAMFRRCLVRITRQSSCEDDERAKQRIRGEVDSQRAHCAGASARRAAAAPLSLVAPSVARFLSAGATVLALCRLRAN
ncbi:hypothetical protein HPB50_023161 [Hyalomma asiaticum]|uniref:Uncharacterized protein n=1 Tax=Hyalomma asiaticum TaxID=266040 RepID=A0ACB7TQ84_HYAAI|nr:hypothetical protein HPB50_023161 [Hyalomma asiaticum]